MGDDKMIRCEACGNRVAMVRSVRMRLNTDAEWERLTAAFPDLNDVPEDRREEVDRAYLQYQRNSQYRRAFICLPCYAKLDNDYGVASILTTDGQTKPFGLNGECRHGRATVCDYSKWLKYQKRKAGEMGIELTD